MSRGDAERTADILDAAQELADAVVVGHHDFVTSLLRVRAAERLLEIIGEASNQLSDEFRAAHRPGGRLISREADASGAGTRPP